MAHAILTAIGADRPGLVDEVSQYIFDRGGNIEDSRMVNLRGQFAMMMLIAGEQRAIDQIRHDLGVLTDTSRLHAELRPAEEPRDAAAPARPFRLTATGMDQAGLVHRLAHLLREMQVNIESLETQLSAAPVTGAPLFDMQMILSVPQTTSVTKVREALGKLCDELNIDWQLATM